MPTLSTQSPDSSGPSDRPGRPEGDVYSPAFAAWALLLTLAALGRPRRSTVGAERSVRVGMTPVESRAGPARWLDDMTCSSSAPSGEMTAGYCARGTCRARTAIGRARLGA